jgi:Arc/MetJ-type ribon-helix-helix transcriptional regulator
MELELTDDQRSLARHAIEAGRLQSEADAVIEAMALWEARERHRHELIASLVPLHLSEGILTQP